MPIQLSDEQRRAIEILLNSTARVQTLGGYAGTGKTTIIRELKERLPGYVVMALTNKAVNVLRRKGVPSDTIHSTIYHTVKEDWRDSEGKLHTKLIFEPKNQVDASGFIVDEASMVSFDINQDLRRLGRPIIYIGDHGQLPPAGGRDFNLMANPDIILETIHRNAGEIARFAEFIREGDCPEYWSLTHDYTGEQVELLGEALMGHLLTADQTICARNATRVLLNRQYREHMGYPADHPVPGDRVMCLQTDKTLGVFNGMQGTVKSVLGDKMVFSTEEKDYPLWFNPEQFNREERPSGRGARLAFDYAYAITCHKAQGDEWDNVLVFEQKCGTWEHSRWAYTAASRAREKLTWVVE